MNTKKTNLETQNPALSKGDVSGSGFITELNCFRWKEEDSNEQEYFGIEIEKTKDIAEAIKRAKNEADGETFVCGYYTDGDGYGKGEYHGLFESKLKVEILML